MKTEKITFGAGCFWQVEYDFKNVNGITKTAVGYMGGDEKKYPSLTYDEVCSDKTGFVEVCEVEYNPKEISFKKLLKIFWKIHDPTQLNRQGPDYGSQYKSAIFYYTLGQKKLAENSIKKEQKKHVDKIVTEIKKAGKFYKAEDYHQNYLEKRGLKTCRI
ncbi:peptide-methionine (S)-S-oxide reductase MsrA [Candidatus Pacearchaeota archaeon]|nr:peptide-methionine (S)-S-oxide reductase MsrA [Candidatus Pacearchaeota archaeon]